MTEETVCAPVPSLHAPDAPADGPTLPAQASVIDAPNDEVTKLAAAPVKRPHMPALPTVGQRKRHDFACGQATGQGPIRNFDGNTLMDGACDG